MTPAGAGVLPCAPAAVPSVSGEQQRQVESRSRGRRSRSSDEGTDGCAKKRSRRRSPSSERSSRRREKRYRSSSDSSEEARADASPPRPRRAHGGARTSWDFDRSLSSARDERDRSGARRRSPGPSGVADDDRSSTFESVDFARTEANVTTKIRPVFNCSLKMGKSPSLNEAAFPGIDLMNNLLSLLLYFRSNFYVLLSDIAKAFLQIRLASEENKNRFCFFRKINGKFVPYRYRTIIFGFVSSPFIFNYVIQYHLSAHASDNVSSLIRDKFYVDNLILTCNNDVMLSQYVDSIRRLMLEGGLPLREWVSNYPSALNQLSEEEISSSNPVKALGYSYDAD